MNKVSEDSGYEEEILIRGTCVSVCTPNSGSLYRRTFSFDADKQPITQVLFTQFSTPSSSADSSVVTKSPNATTKADLSPAKTNTSAKALVVLLKTLIHIIYLDGGSYIVHLPFPVLKLWSIPLGLLIERHSDSEQGPMIADHSFSNEEQPLPRLFTLSGPLEDFGMVTCNGNSLDTDEEILYISSSSDSLCVTKTKSRNRITLWFASPDEQAGRKPTKRPFRRRSSIGSASVFMFKEPYSDADIPPMERHSSRVSEVIHMDRTSFADPDRVTVLMSEPQGLKQELSLHIIESFNFDSDVNHPDIFILTPSSKTDILCFHERRAQVLHLFHLLRRGNGVPTFKERTKIPALSAAPIRIHRSMRLLVLSPDLILRVHAPWSTRLNIVFPSTRSWASISQVEGNNVTLTDANGHFERFQLDLIPQHPIVERCLDILECVLDISLYSLFLSVYGNVKVKTKTDDLSAFTITLFACFLACNTRSPSPGPSGPSEAKPKLDPWQILQSLLSQDPTYPGRVRMTDKFAHLSLIPQAHEFVHHFEGTQRSSHLSVILLAFHALSEELRVQLPMSQHNRVFVVILCQLAYWLGRTKFVEYYTASDIHMDTIDFDKRPLAGLRDANHSYNEPWSIYTWLISCVRDTRDDNPRDDILTLEALLLNADPKISPNSTKINHARSLLPSIEKLRKVYPLLNTLDFRDILIHAMEENSVTNTWLDSLPLGVAYPIKIALSQCQRDPLPTWSESAYQLIDRKDLVEFLRFQENDTKPTPKYISLPRSTDEVSSVSEICQKIQSPESMSSGPTFADDHERITNLIFRKDRRMLEVYKLLEFSQPGVTFWFRMPPTVTEHAAATAQQITVQALAIRALAMPVGKGLLTFNSRTPLPTEKFHVPGFSFVFRMKPQNTIMTVDKSFLSDSVTQWPLFHLGVSGALSISPESKDIDTSWIIFNKPDEPTSRHAGFLFGLGLTGHLKKLARWHLLNYLTTKHVLTSVALLLGLGVSYLGTKDPKITKLLSVHIAAMLPPGAADLKINVWIQTAGIMALGLLYFDTRHRSTSEVLLSELTATGKVPPFSYSSSIPPDLQRDESYRVACGFALGFINLGKGSDLRGFDERKMIEKLCRITEGLIVSDNAENNMIVAIPGCIVALALMYLRTNNKNIAKTLDVPQTPQLMEYVRPDLLFLRTVAKNLVMWDSIEPTHKWISSQYPPRLLKQRTLLSALDSDALDLISILTGACYVLGLRFAGTHSKEAKGCLLFHFDRLMAVCSQKAMTFDEKITMINLRNFQDALCVSLAAVMAGSGDLDVLRRLRKLHGRRHDQANYGGHMAAHMAVGLLFMSGGQYTLGTSPLSTAALFCATYPKFPTTPSDNNFHLQALRHLWILAAENRCLIPRSVDTYQPALVPLRVSIKTVSGDPKILEFTAPCILPAFSSLRSIETASNKFQHLVLDFEARADLLAHFKRNPLIFVSNNAISTAFKTSFEQGLARVLRPENVEQRKSIARSVRDCIQCNYLEEVHGSSEDIGVQFMSEVDTRETPLDIKCGLIHSLSHAETTDALFDVKLAFTGYNARRKKGIAETSDETWMQDFIERAQFRFRGDAQPGTRL